jgi:hypothetical protein
MANPSRSPMRSDVTRGRWLTPATTGSTDAKSVSKRRLRTNLSPTISAQRPTAWIEVSRVTARVRAVRGLLTLMRSASGQHRSMARATSMITGTLRRALEIPPGPTLSPTVWRTP